MAHITIFRPTKVKLGSTEKVVCLDLYDEEDNWICIHFKDQNALEQFGEDVDKAIGL